MSGEKTVTTNKKARFEYHIEDTFEAGLALVGTEVKSIREGRATISEGYCQFEDGELFLVEANFAPYSYGNRNNHDPMRKRKLLLHKRELHKLEQKIAERGYTLVPLRLYFKDGKAKLMVGLAKGKKQYDKRETEKKREANLEIRRAMKK